MIILIDKHSPILTIKFVDNFKEKDYKLFKQLTRELFIGGKDITDKYRKEKQKIYTLNIDSFSLLSENTETYYVLKLINFVRKNMKSLSEFIVEINFYNNEGGIMKDLAEQFVKVFNTNIPVNFNYIDNEIKWL